MKYLAILVAFAIPSVAVAEDIRMPELMRLMVTAQKCKIETNLPAEHFFSGLSDLVDKKSAEAASIEAKAAVDADFLSKGAITVCWNAWDKMRDNGFLQPYFPTLPAPAAKP